MSAKSVRMRLHEYIEATGGTKASFALRSGVAERTIDRITKGCGCRLDVANKIVRASHSVPTPSGGVVTFEELVPAESAA